MLLCHHIASDGWSMRVLMADLATAYAAAPGGRAPDWPDLPVQYADYALWQRELLGRDEADGGVLAGQVGYWQQALAGLPEELALPRPAAPGRAVAARRGGRVAAGGRGAARGRWPSWRASTRRRCSWCCMAGLAALLSRMGAGTDIPIGAPVAGRTDEAVHDLVGFFVNTLVLRTDLSGDPSFARAAGPGTGDRAGRPGPPGRAVRAAGGGAEPGPVPGAAPAVPGDAG